MRLRAAKALALSQPKSLSTVTPNVRCQALGQTHTAGHKRSPLDGNCGAPAVRLEGATGTESIHGGYDFSWRTPAPPAPEPQPWAGSGSPFDDAAGHRDSALQGGAAMVLG